MDPVSEILDDKGREVFTIDPDAYVFDAVRSMCERKVGSLVVCDDGVPIATFTERDLMTRVVLAGLDPKTTTVRSVMTPAAACIGPQTEARQAMSIMTQRRCRHLPVVVDARLVGLVSIGDLVRWMARMQAAELSTLRDQVTYGA